MADATREELTVGVLKEVLTNYEDDTKVRISMVEVYPKKDPYTTVDSHNGERQVYTIGDGGDKDVIYFEIFEDQEDEQYLD
jgi:hypothetical protein